MSEKLVVQKQPIAFIFAGANASGKSTFISTLYQCGILSGEFVNPDKILKEELQLPETKENYEKAFVIGEERRNTCMLEKKDMVVETVYSTQDKINFVKRLKDHGYQVTMVFTGVDSVQVNALYLLDRVIKGGHDVPLRKLVDRRVRSFDNMAKSLHLFDCAVFVDNTVMGEPPVVLKSIANGGICYVGETDRELSWLDTIIDRSFEQIDEELIGQPYIQKHLDFCASIRTAIDEQFMNTTDMPYTEVNASIRKVKNEAVLGLKDAVESVNEMNRNSTAPKL